MERGGTKGGKELQVGRKQSVPPGSAYFPENGDRVYGEVTVESQLQSCGWAWRIRYRGKEGMWSSEACLPALLACCFPGRLGWLELVAGISG